MTKRYIVMLPPIPLVDESDEPILLETGEQQQCTHPAFIRARTMDGVFGETLDGICAAQAIRGKVKGLGPADVLELDEDEWQLLTRAVMAPQTLKYHPLVGPQLVRLALAVKNASTERPLPSSLKAAE